jgi:hypothetical protein
MTVSMLLVNTVASCERWHRHELLDIAAQSPKLAAVR